MGSCLNSDSRSARWSSDYNLGSTESLLTMGCAGKLLTTALLILVQSLGMWHMMALRQTLAGAMAAWPSTSTAGPSSTATGN